MKAYTENLSIRIVCAVNSVSDKLIPFKCMSNEFQM